MKDKLKASGIHLLASILVVSLFLTFVLLVWYPQPTFGISGIKNILITLISVDLILGPLLTFILFKKNKPTLKFDLSAIVAIQVVALAYGAFTIYEGHPVYIAYTADRFTLVAAKDVFPENAKYNELKKSKLTGPMLVYAKRPEDPKIANEILFEVISGGADIDARAEFYEPYENNIDSIFEHGLDPKKLFKSEENMKKLTTFLEKHGKTDNDYAYLPLSGKENHVVWALDKENGKPIDVIDIDPWEG